PASVPLRDAVVRSAYPGKTPEPSPPTWSPPPPEPGKRGHAPPRKYWMSEAACAPIPLAKVVPFRVIVVPSPPAKPPLLMSFSAGPYPFVIDVHVRSLT